jgi:VWFA-related protein
MGADGAVERFQLSAKNFSVITESQMQTAGRKLLVWLGPGWPLVNNDRTSFNENVRRQNFEAISMLLNRMREVQVTAYNVRSFADDYSNSDYYQQFLKPVTKMAESDSGDLALGVLAVESGGRVTSPSNDVAVEIASCVGEARAYYTLKFEPVAIGKVGSYHSIEVKVARPDVKVRAVVGYYEEAGRTSK